jgi:hypothetical protein
MNNKKLRASVAAALMLFALCGCSTLEYVRIDRSRPESLRSRLEVGETVNVRLQSGEQYQFRIVALEADAIVGRDQRIAYTDIDLLEVKKRDYEGTVKTALTVTAIAAMLAALLVIEAELDRESQENIYCDGRGWCETR